MISTDGVRKDGAVGDASAATLAVIAALGFSSGIPNLMLTSVVRTWTTAAQWSIESIGLLSLLSLPYALKFLWAPIVDHLRPPLCGALGQRRSWLFAGHLIAALLLTGACVVGPSDARVFLTLLAVAAIASATIDIAASAYQIDGLPRAAFGKGAGLFVSGYRVAWAGLGLAVLAVAPVWGWTFAASAACALVTVGAVVTLWAVEPTRSDQPAPGFAAALWEPLALFASQWGRRLPILLLFVLTFKLPDQVGNAMIEPLLLKGLGHSLQDLAFIRQGLGFGITIVGAVAGGWLVGRIGLRPCLWIFGVLQAISNAGFLWLASMQGASIAGDAVAAAPLPALTVVVMVESLASGMVSAGFVAALMSLCERRVAATQYALLTALMAVGGAIGGSISGVLLRHLDYGPFFGWSVLLGVPGLLCIPMLRSRTA
ncbi:MAG: AmpG family muropeptide MFS transporter [Planctomycetes bacterium]|nr:AmpG family muropeptide MFS transporter [Planctomycetota bacterium]